MEGDRKLEILQEKMLSACSTTTDLEQQVSKLKALARRITQLEACLNDEMISGSALVSALGIDDTDTYITQDIVPTIVTNAYEEELIGEAPGDGSWDTPIPAQAFLRHTYFVLKDVHQNFKKAAETRSKLQQKHATLKEKMDVRLSKKRKRAESGVAKVESQRKPGRREMLLARRNQINRARKGHKKVRKVRCEEGLPEVRGVDRVCQ